MDVELIHEYEENPDLCKSFWPNIDKEADIEEHHSGFVNFTNISFLFN